MPVQAPQTPCSASVSPSTAARPGTPRRHRDTPRPPSQIVKVVVPRSAKPEFKELGGSDSDHFNQMLAEQTLEALWVAHSTTASVIANT